MGHDSILAEQGPQAHRCPHGPATCVWVGEFYSTSPSHSWRSKRCTWSRRPGWTRGPPAGPCQSRRPRDGCGRRLACGPLGEGAASEATPASPASGTGACSPAVYLASHALQPRALLERRCQLRLLRRRGRLRFRRLGLLRRPRRVRRAALLLLVLLLLALLALAPPLRRLLLRLELLCNRGDSGEQSRGEQGSEQCGAPNLFDGLGQWACQEAAAGRNSAVKLGRRSCSQSEACCQDCELSCSQP